MKKLTNPYFITTYKNQTHSFISIRKAQCDNFCNPRLQKWNLSRKTKDNNRPLILPLNLLLKASFPPACPPLAVKVIPLVPKLYLGTQSLLKLYFLSPHPHRLWQQIDFKHRMIPTFIIPRRRITPMFRHIHQPPSDRIMMYISNLLPQHSIILNELRVRTLLPDLITAAVLECLLAISELMQQPVLLRGLRPTY